jgi:DNA invertase Pin-like site-specific DNA recombinase
MNMKPAVLYARVSSREQEREGYSIPAQLKLLREYAAKQGYQIVREFIDIETAKTAGRKQFGEMVQFLEKNDACRVVLVEKTDRLYRNLRDCVTLEDLGVEIHLPKEGQIIGKNSKSQAKLMHGIQLVIARNYVENLTEGVKKGMREKAAQGIYPGRPPLGYRNNKLHHTIELHPENAEVAKRLFELYATGNYSLADLRQIIRTETGKRITKSHIHDGILRNEFYIGFFIWGGERYKASHLALVTPELFQRVQAVFDGRNKPKYKKHKFAFGGLLTCAYDNCRITAELKKERYAYYRCTGYKGKCVLPRMREAELGRRLGAILQGIHVSGELLKQLEKSLAEHERLAQSQKRQQREKLEQRLANVRQRIDQVYLDKLDGKVSEDFWQTKTTEWRVEEQQLVATVQRLQQVTSASPLNAKKISELADKAHSLYVLQSSVEQGKLLKKLLVMCRVDAAHLYPTYRKPLDLLMSSQNTLVRKQSSPV